MTTTVASVAERKGEELEAEFASTRCHLGRDALLRSRIIKIDVEGAELSELMESPHLLHQFSDKTEWVFKVTPQAIEEQGRAVTEMLDVFRAAGYKLYCIANDYSVLHSNTSKDIPADGVGGVPCPRSPRGRQQGRPNRRRSRDN